MNWDKFFASPALMDSARRRLSDRVVKSGDCLLWKGCKGSRGYGCMAVGKRNHEATHRLAWALANGVKPPVGMHVMHSCDTPSCVNPAHLSIGTAADNQRDCSTKGRKNSVRGSRCKHSKLTEFQVLAAAHDFARGAFSRDIAKKFGVKRDAILKIMQGRGWPHMQPILRPIIANRRRIEMERQGVMQMEAA
jgi:hypothetical protein